MNIEDDRKKKLDVPPHYTVKSAFSSVEPIGDFADFDEQIREAKEERAEKLVRLMRWR